MLSLALVNLGLAADYVINVVHDEIVAHAPDKIVQHVADDIERVMRWAADEILSPWGIPGDAEVKISKRWGK